MSSTIRSGTRMDILLRKHYGYLRRKYDSFILITGMEGRGKSKILLSIIDHWYTDILQQPIKRDCYGVSFRPFINALRSAASCDIAALDEGGDELDRDDYRNELNSMMYKMYTIIRGKCIFTIVCLPSFFDFNPRFRKRRIRGVIDVSKRVDNHCNSCNADFVESSCPWCGSSDFVRGYAVWKYYSRKKLDLILIKNMNRPIKKMNVVKPTLQGRLREYNGILLKEYEAKKEEKMDTTIDDIWKMVDTLEKDKERIRCPRCQSSSFKFMARKKLLRCQKCGCEFDPKKKEDDV